MGLRIVALLLTGMTGFSGLVYEVAWQRYLATLLGSHSEATAAVLGIFLGGLAAGYALFGVVTRRRIERAARAQQAVRMLGLYGAVEAAIGAYALAFPLIFRAAVGVSGQLSLGGGTLGFVADVVLTALLLGPPTVLMGGTIPMLSQALASTLADATRFHALVYASNTLGAFGGALAAGLVLVPWLGLDASMRWMGLVNLVAGVAFLALDTRQRRPVPAAAPTPDAAAPRGFIWIGAAALLAGFAMMALQTTLIRMGGLAMGPSQATFAMVVAVFVLCIALGGGAVSFPSRIPVGTVVVVQWTLVVVLLVLYPKLQNLPYYMHCVRSLFRSESIAFLPYHIGCFLVLLGLFFVPVGLSGALLPLLFHELRREIGQLGAVAGRLYAWNTVGSLLGALLGGYLLLAFVDLHHVYRIATLALAVTAVLLSVRLLAFPGITACAVGLVVTSMVTLNQGPWSPRRTATGVFRTRAETPDTWQGADAFFARWRSASEIVFFDDDPTSTVTAIETRSPTVSGLVQYAIFTNGKPDTSVPTELATVVSLSVLPCLFAERCERAFAIGLGTGTTAGELAQLEGMTEVVAAEISPAVVRALPKFASSNHGVWRDPKVTIRRSDAYRALLRDDTTYDVISSEPSNPWVAGVENLFSEELLRAAKARLRPGGVYAQWLQVYEISPDTFALILRTFTSVFEHVSLWSTYQGDVILLCGDGALDHVLDPARLEQRAALPSYAAALQRAGFGRLPVLLWRELLPADVMAAGLSPGPKQSLFHPILSHVATRDFFTTTGVQIRVSAEQREAALARRNSALRRWVDRRNGRVADDDFAALAEDACIVERRDCATVLAWWRRVAPESSAMALELRRMLELGAVTRDDIALFAALFDPSEVRGAMPAATVGALAAAYEGSFHPAAPFTRQRLASIFDACDDGGSGECAATRSATEERIGPLAREQAARR